MRVADDDALQRSAQVGALLVEKVVEVIQEMRSIDIITRVLTPGVNQDRAPFELDQRGCCLADVDTSKPLRARGPVPLSFATSGDARDFRGDAIRDNRADHEDRRFAPGRRLFERLMTRAFLGSGVLIDAVTMSMRVAGTRSANAKHDWAIRAAVSRAPYRGQRSKSAVLRPG